MRISQRLMIAALVPTLVALVAVVGVVFSYSPLVRLQGQEAVAIDIGTDLNALDDLARSYLLHHDERSRRQFLAMAQRASAEIGFAESQHGKYAGRLRAIETDVVVIRSLFSRIVANRVAPPAGAQPALLSEAEERLSAQLFIHSADAVTLAGGVAHGISRDIVGTEQRVSLAVTIFTILAASLLTAVSLALRRSITRSLHVLTAGTEAVGAGSLDYRIGLTGNDELGELGRSFDRMTERLQGVTVSRNELETEVQERRLAEERATQELETTRALLEAAERLAAVTDVDQTFAALARVVRASARHSRATIETWEPELGALRVVAVDGEGTLPVGTLLHWESMNETSHDLLENPRTVLNDFDAAPSKAPERADVWEVRLLLQVPILYRDRLLGLVTLDEPGERREFSEREIRIVEGIAAQAAVAIENARLLRREQARRRRIEALHGVMEVVVSSLDLRDVAGRMLEYLVEHHAFELANVWLASGENLELIAAINYPEAYAERFSPASLSADLDPQTVYRTGKPIVVSNAEATSPLVRERYASIGVQLGAFAVIPLRSRGRTIGTLHFGWREPRDIGAEDVDFYSSLGSELGIALENARLYETERSIADRLQEALLSLPESLPGVEFAHAYHSATEAARVGGDFYDVFEIEHGLVGITIGDVAGKGLDAAVLTSLVKNAIRVHASEKGATPARILALTNDVIYKTTSTESFVTVFFGVLDAEDGRLVYSNAGHTTAAVVSEDGRVARVAVTGPILGAFGDIEFGEGETCLETDELLFLYTDGLTEARRDHELFGEERLFDLLRQGEDGSPAVTVRSAIDAVLEYAGGRLNDDLALLALKRLKGERRVPSQQKLDLL